jgi:SAM-dependent methyltransferase
VTSDTFDRREGRALFGADAAGYDSARPGHAERVYDVLREGCGLGPGTSVLEIGPGTGQATWRLLELGADPIVALEPDPVLAAYLEDSCGGGVDVQVVALEDAQLPANGFDLAVAASSFHWVEEGLGLAKIVGALRRGGWIALWWTVFGYDEEPDAFIRAVDPLFDGLQASPSSGEKGRPSFALDTGQRLAALEAAGFEDLQHELMSWTASWDAAGIRLLYSTFSPICRLEHGRREELLDVVERIATVEFGGRVEKSLRTSLYTARRPE